MSESKDIGVVIGLSLKKRQTPRPILEQHSSFPQQQAIVTTSRATPQQHQQITVKLIKGESTIYPDKYRIAVLVTMLNNSSTSNNNSEHQQRSVSDSYSRCQLVVMLISSLLRNNITIVTITSQQLQRIQPMLPMQQRQYEQQNANNNFNGCSSIGTGDLTSDMPPAIAVVENGTAGNMKVTSNENKILL
ncbi:uncharacterized protein ACN427_009120 [Glossina fuscipes fuscipes]